MGDDEGIGCLILVLIGAVIIWAWEPWSEWSTELTVYPVACADWNEKARSCSAYTSRDRRTYDVNESRAEVVYWDPGSDQIEPRKLINCTIRDVRNWICHRPGGSGTLAVRNGFQKRSALEKIVGRVYVRKYQWHVIDVVAPLSDFDLSFLVPDQYD